MTSTQRAQMAMSYLRAGRTSDALKAIDEALAEEPANARLNYVSAQIYFQAGELQQALDGFDKSVELDPYLTDAHNFRGVILQELGRAAEAEQAFKRVLEDRAYPTPDKAYMNLGLLYVGQDRHQEALTQFRRAVEVNPKNYQAQFEQAAVLDTLGQLQQAARLYEVARPGYQGSGDYHYRLAMVYFKLERHQESLASLRRCLDVAPGSESAAKCSEMLEVMR